MSVPSGAVNGLTRPSSSSQPTSESAKRARETGLFESPEGCHRVPAALTEEQLSRNDRGRAVAPGLRHLQSHDVLAGFLAPPSEEVDQGVLFAGQLCHTGEEIHLLLAPWRVFRLLPGTAKVRHHVGERFGPPEIIRHRSAPVLGLLTSRLLG